MNPVKKALAEIKYRIPRDILEIAFNYKTRSPSGSTIAPNISLDERIMNQIIRPRVLVDCDLVGGMELVVSLAGLRPEMLDNYTIVFKIPDDRLLNRTIVSVLSVSYLPYGNYANGVGLGSYNNVTPTRINDVSSVGQRLADSYSSIPPISDASCELIGHNTVMITSSYQFVSFLFAVRCVVSNEKNLNNINPRSYLAFSKLCELAVKSYIYNNMIVAIDQGYLQGGQELGIVKTYIESLSDAEENYQTYLKETWRKVAAMNDRTTATRFIKMQISPGI